MEYTKIFHPGATTPILECYTIPRSPTVGDWTATYQCRTNDKDATAALTVIGAITEVSTTSLPDELRNYYTDVPLVWHIVVTPTSAQTQSLRGEFIFGCDLTTAAGQNHPLFDDEMTVFFISDPVRV